MKDLHVDDELAAVIADDKDSDAAATCLEGFAKAGPEVGLIDDGQSLLDITSLGHGNDGTILEVENAVLLEDRTQHGLNNDTWARVRDECRLFMQLFGEEVDTQVSVLAGGVGGGNLDDLARTALEHQEVAQSDMVTWDGDGVGGDAFRRGLARSIFIVVTHLVVFEARRFDGFFGYVDFLFVCRAERTRGIYG